MGLGLAGHPLPIMSKISVVTVTSSSTHGVTAFTHRFPCPQSIDGFGFLWRAMYGAFPPKERPADGEAP